MKTEHGLKVFSEGKSEDALLQNLQKIREQEIMQGNLDWVIAVEGEEGEAGKSALAQAIAVALEGEEFNPEEQIALDAETFKEKARELEPGKVIIFDEGVEGLMAADTMTTEGRSIVRFLRQCRELNLIIIICMPVFMEMNKKIRKNRVKTLASCKLSRKGGRRQRFALFFNKTQIRGSDLSKNVDANEVRYPDAVLKAVWNNPEKGWPDIWNTYIEMKEGIVRDEEGKEEEIDLGQVVRIVKKRKRDYMDVTRGGQKYIAKELIEEDFDIGGRKSNRVKKVVERDLGLRRIDQQEAEEKAE